jgi:hypothetical protein
MLRSERQPEVILDFIFEDGLFFIAIKNIGAGPAHDVSVAFDKKFTGVEGAKEISAMPLFRKIPFLAPQKEIRAFLDHSASYFHRRQPTNIRATITFKDSAGVKHSSVLKHDLKIYRDIGYVRRHTEADGMKPFQMS